MSIELYPHQKDALLRMHDGCVLTGGVGTGKTLTALAYYKKKHPGKPLYIFTTARKRDDDDWQKEAKLLGIDNLFVDSWNNIDKYNDISNSFVIADEQRLVGTGKWAKTFIHISKSNSWILLSATPGDNWLDYATIFIANGFYKNITQFKREHVVYNNYAKFPKVDRYIGVGKLLKLRSMVLVDMPFERSTTRHLTRIHVGYDIRILKMVMEERWNVFDQEPITDVAQMIGVARRVVNSYPERLDYIRKLAWKERKVIVFYNFDYELDILRKLSNEFVVAEWNGHKHEPVPDCDEPWVYLVQYTAGAEAWNCVTTNQMVFYSLNYSYKIFEQAQGRIDRINTKFKDLYYHILISNAPIDQMIWKALVHKKNFNERKYREKLSKEIL